MGFSRACFSSARGSHDWEHTERVYKLCMKIAEAERADKEVLAIAAWLHDVGRTYQDESRGSLCHAEKGVEMAEEVLHAYPISQGKKHNILHCIRTHRYRGACKPETPEAKILYDADKLDAIGAIGVARAYAIAGHHGQRLWAKVPDGFAERSIEEARGDMTDGEHTPVHEYWFKLSKLRDALFTTTAQAIAADRHDYMARFFERLRLEINGEL